MSHTPMSHVTHINKSRHTHQWVMSHTSMSHVAHINMSCRTHQWVMSCHTRQWVMTNHVTHMNESCHTSKWVTPHVWTSHATYMNESCHTHSSLKTYDFQELNLTHIRVKSQVRTYQSPYISNTFSREFPKFQTGVHVTKQSPRHSKQFTVKP